jgi:hypothetical protein
MQKLSLTLLFLSLPTIADSMSFDSPYGTFVITEDLSSMERTFKFNNNYLGKASDYIKMDAERLPNPDEKHKSIIMLKGFTGGSGCESVLSIVTIKEDGVFFSPSLLTCGGVHDIFIKDGYVVVNADEDRDNKVKVTYTVLDSSVSKNGLPIKEPRAFIEK